MSSSTIALLLRLAVGLAVLYALLLGLLYVFQSRLIHLPHVPGRELVATPADAGLHYRDVEMVTGDDLRLHGWFVPAAEERAVLLFLHGNAGNVSHRLDSLEIFHALGLSVLIIDYRGYGRSEGRPSEDGLYRDGQAAMDFLAGELQVAPGEVLVFGRSLGAAVAAHVAARNPVAGLVLESAFTSVADMGAELYPMFPVRPLVRHRYPTLETLQEVSAPLLVIHSPEDEIIPFHHGRTLYEHGPEARLLLRIAGDHNTGFLRHRERYVAGWRLFMDDYLGEDPPGPGVTDGRE